jgi:parvulin-like peptidyl-prolyl isomerase
MLAGCAGPAAPPRDRSTSPAQQEPTRDSDADRIVALVNGQPLTWEALRRPLAERAGDEILREVVLDHLLRRRLRELGITMQPADLEREESRLLEQIADDPGSAEQLLEAIRERRGLGETRYQALLWRNAALRRLVQPEGSPISEAALRSVYEQTYGDLYELRLLTTATLAEARQARRRLEAGEPFAEVAATMSTDVSRHRGGLLDPLSLADPTYPQVIRDAARELAVGSVSVPLALEDGYAMVRLERIVEREQPDLAAVREDLAEEVRLRQERLLMDEFARSLLEEARITVFERGIDWRGDAG